MKFFFRTKLEELEEINGDLSKIQQRTMVHKSVCESEEARWSPRVPQRINERLLQRFSEKNEKCVVNLNVRLPLLHLFGFTPQDWRSRNSLSRTRDRANTVDPVIFWKSNHSSFPRELVRIGQILCSAKVSKTCRAVSYINWDENEDIGYLEVS